MKETTKVASSLDEAFRIAGFNRIAGHNLGRKYYTCPRCSSQRHGFNRSARCVGVNVDSLGLRSFCNHCDDEQVVMIEDAIKSSGGQSSAGQGRSMADRQQPKKQNGYTAMHRNARVNWVRRS